MLSRGAKSMFRNEDVDECEEPTNCSFETSLSGVLERNLLPGCGQSLKKDVVVEAAAFL